MDSSQEIRDRYASEAETYRRDAWLINFDAEYLFNEFKSIITKLLNYKEGELKILDIGAGNGMLTELVLSCFPDAKITMLDFSSEMLESAKAIFKANGINLENIDFTIRNFITDDLPNEKYDLIVSSYALHHIRKADDLKSVYLKIANALNDNGSFACLDNYLETGEEARKNQGRTAIEKWTLNYNSEKIAREWADILKTEDSPATIPLIVSSLNECVNSMRVIPFLLPKKGVMATIYGMTKLDLNKLNELQLIEYVNETKEYIGKEELIDSFHFE